jgi:radical SAM superfamily enzyme YgiQ (UPF0313 family)
LGEKRSYDAMEPLVFAILGSLTPPDVELALYDERIESIPFGEPTDLVALTVETYTAQRAYAIADAYRRRGVKVVMGGVHPTLIPAEALEHADAVVREDGEQVWPEIVEDARHGRLRQIYRAEDFGSLAGLRPDHAIFRGKRYAPIGLVQYGRGCRYNCDFCSIKAFYGRSLRQRPVRDVVAEIESLERDVVFFVDDNLFVGSSKMRELLEALVPLRISWSCQITLDVTQDPELVRLMGKSGCIAALIGFESLQPASLRQIRKGWNLRYGGYERVIRMFRDAGVMLYGTFVFGSDDDTPATFDTTVDFAVRNKLFLANFNPLTPTPATDLFERLKREGRLLHDRWWLDPTYRYGDATFAPRGMTPEELRDGCLRSRLRFNTWSSIARRMLVPKTTLRSPHRAGIYLRANLISRREIVSKQGMQLGAAIEAPP